MFEPKSETDQPVELRIVPKSIVVHESNREVSTEEQYGVLLLQLITLCLLELKDSFATVFMLITINAYCVSIIVDRWKMAHAQKVLLKKRN